MTRIYNFSAGPSTFPAAVLKRARDELLEWGDTGMSVMEMSHRGKAFIGIAEKAGSGQSGGAPFRRRTPGQHLQRHAGSRGGCPGGLHG